MIIQIACADLKIYNICRSAVPDRHVKVKPLGQTGKERSDRQRDKLIDNLIKQICPSVPRLIPSFPFCLCLSSFFPSLIPSLPSFFPFYLIPGFSFLSLIPFFPSFFDLICSSIFFCCLNSPPPPPSPFCCCCCCRCCCCCCCFNIFLPSFLFFSLFLRFVSFVHLMQSFVCVFLLLVFFFCFSFFFSFVLFFPLFFFFFFLFFFFLCLILSFLFLFLPFFSFSSKINFLSFASLLSEYIPSIHSFLLFPFS